VTWSLWCSVRGAYVVTKFLYGNSTLAPWDVTWCSGFSPPTSITCDKRCLTTDRRLWIPFPRVIRTRLPDAPPFTLMSHAHRCPRCGLTWVHRTAACAANDREPLRCGLCQVADRFGITPTLQSKEPQDAQPDE